MRTIALLTLLSFTAPALAADETTPAQPTMQSPLAPPAPAATPATTPPSPTPEPAGIQAPPPAPSPPAPPKPPAAPPPRVSSKSVLPEMPEVPDEPLPDWTPPPPTPKESRRALFLRMAPEVQQAQRMRQAGMWISAFGWAGVLTGGILFAHTSNNNVVQGISTPNLDETVGLNQMDVNAGLGLMITGGALAALGFSMFTVGQWRLSVWHKKRPSDTMPSMSGF